MIRVALASAAAGAVVAMAAVWAWQAFGPRHLPLVWEGLDR